MKLSGGWSPGGGFGEEKRERHVICDWPTSPDRKMDSRDQLFPLFDVTACKRAGILSTALDISLLLCNDISSSQRLLTCPHLADVSSPRGRDPASLSSSPLSLPPT